MAILALGGLVSGVAQAQSMAAGCYPIKGKIVNNLHTPIPLHTMGVAAVVLPNNVKVKCAVEGTPAVPTNPSPDSLAFVHTLSCDDAIATPLGPVHSKAQFNTQGTVNFATGFFTETSTPIEGSGTGKFQGVTVNGSYLSIEGRVWPSGAVDMTFTGQLCY
jgi:hypothetical protein